VWELAVGRVTGSCSSSQHYYGRFASLPYLRCTTRTTKTVNVMGSARPGALMPIIAPSYPFRMCSWARLIPRGRQLHDKENFAMWSRAGALYPRTGAECTQEDEHGGNVHNSAGAAKSTYYRTLRVAGAMVSCACASLACQTHVADPLRCSTISATANGRRSKVHGQGMASIQGRRC
jgi:hypothetical protein